MLPTKPEYVDQLFFNHYRELKSRTARTSEEDKFMEAFEPMMNNIIFNNEVEKAWKQLIKYKEGFKKDFDRLRYDTDYYQFYEDDKKSDGISLKKGDFLWYQDRRCKTGIPKPYDYCDIESENWNYRGDVEEAYYRKVIFPLFNAFIECNGLIHYGHEVTKPEVLRKKAVRVESAIAELRESIHELENTPQFDDFYLAAIGPEIFKFSHSVFSEKNGLKPRNFRDYLDLYEKIAKAYSLTLKNQDNRGLKPRPYLIKSLLRIFLDAFDTPLLEAVSIFASVALGESIDQSEVSRFKKRTDLKNFTPYLKYSSNYIP